MDDWDNDEEIVTPANWEDDEDMDEIAINQRTPANWDDDSDDEEENKTGEPSSIQPSPSQTAAIVKPKKKSLGQKISEREARQSDLESASKDQFQEEEEESIQKRKEREHNLIQQSDLQNAQDLFAQTSLQNGSSNDLNTSFHESTPKTRQEFDVYVKYLMAKFITFESQSQYGYFVESLARELSQPLTLEDTRKVSTVISTQINEKQKAFSNKKSKKKGVVVSKKAQLQKSGSSEAVDTFELYEGEYDDFM